MDNPPVVDDPTTCSVWYKLRKGSDEYFEKSDIIIMNGSCLQPIDINTTDYASEEEHMNGYIGTYTQLMKGIPEWFSDLMV